MVRVLVCGTNYGSTYLRALHANEHGLAPAGILARSEQSRQLAAQMNVPFYTSVEDVPRGAIDVACMAISGEAGRAITQALLERGVHVVAEHPQWPADIAAHRELARRHRAVYHINAHYSDIEAAATFVAACRGTLERSRLLFVNLLTNPRAMYSAIELLARALGLRDVVLERVAPTPGAFFTMHRAGLLTIQVQNAVSEVDDGSSNWVSHNVTVGFEEGVLTLVEAFGPVLWVPAPPSVPQLQSATGMELWGRPLWRVLATPPPTYADSISWSRDRANRIALARLVAEIGSGITPPEQSDEHWLAVSTLWQSML